MFLLISLLAVIAASAQSPPGDAHNLFQEYVQKHVKEYNSEEYLKRLDIFKQNLERINKGNARKPQREKGINRFTDLTEEERRQYLGFKHYDPSSDDRAIRLEYPAEAITAPEQFDWRDHGAVTHVKDQGHCQSSYVHSAIGNIEGQYAIKHKKLISLSEQLFLDCMFPSDVQHSTCVEGWPHDVMLYHLLGFGNRGVPSEKEYPNTGGVRRKNCPHTLNRTITFVTNVTEFQIFIPTNEETLKQLLYETGPLAVGFDSSQLFEYTKGIFTTKDCQHNPDHSALLVGYGIENGTKYWTLKNSWGPKWGENGYFRLVRGEKACNMGTSYTVTCTVT